MYYDIDITFDFDYCNTSEIACQYLKQSCYNQNMKRELRDILACPVCKGGLELEVEAEEGQEVISGVLCCHRCDVRYPIVDSIPNLLPPDRG